MLYSYRPAPISLPMGNSAGLYDIFIYIYMFYNINNKTSQFYISRRLARANCMYCNVQYTFTVIIEKFMFNYFIMVFLILYSKKIYK